MYSQSEHNSKRIKGICSCKLLSHPLAIKHNDKNIVETTLTQAEIKLMFHFFPQIILFKQLSFPR